MKVIISCLNSKYVHASLSPWCLLAGIREFSEKSYDVSVMESTINGDIVAFADKIISEKPDVVAFSCYIWNITRVLSLAEKLKEQGIIIALGGPEVSYRQFESEEKAVAFLEAFRYNNCTGSFPCFCIKHGKLPYLL
mgnify:CR=1 FL=1